MYSYNEIRSVHLEISSLCNARCPMCLRNIMGGATNPKLPLAELKLQDIKKIFKEGFIKQLRKIYLCGNYGDPITAKETLEVFKYFRSVNKDIHLSMFTNGSAKDTGWWSELAQIVDNVHFSVDGLADTNHIYRRGTDFNKIIENMKAYIGAGGFVTWDYIVFKHNEHQVEEAKALSLELGVQNFVIKKTGRFFSNQRSKVKTQQEVHNKRGEVEYKLEVPLNEKFRNNALKKEAELIHKYGSLESYLDQTPIKCKVEKEKSIYISSEGLAFPCCWTANQLYPWYFKDKASQIWSLIEQQAHKLSDLSALENDLGTIIDGSFFQKTLPQSWSCKSIESGKLKVCAKTCGSEFDQFKEQFK